MIDDDWQLIDWSTDLAFGVFVCAWKCLPVGASLGSLRSPRSALIGVNDSGDASDLSFDEHYDGWCGMMPLDRGKRLKWWCRRLEFQWTLWWMMRDDALRGWERLREMMMKMMTTVMRIDVGWWWLRMIDHDWWWLTIDWLIDWLFVWFWLIFGWNLASKRGLIRGQNECWCWCF